MTFLSRRFFSIRGVHLFRSNRNNPVSYRWRSPHIRALFSVPFPRVRIHASSRFYLRTARFWLRRLLFSTHISLAPRRGSEMCYVVSVIRFVCASNENEEFIRFVIETEAFAKHILETVIAKTYVITNNKRKKIFKSSLFLPHSVPHGITQKSESTMFCRRESEFSMLKLRKRFVKLKALCST